MRCLLALLACGFLASSIGTASLAHADTIFNNFAAGDTYDKETGWGIGNDALEGQPFSNQTVYTGFAVAGSGRFSLDRLTLAISLILGDNTLDVALYSDSDGEPGTVLETFHLSGAMGAFGKLNPPLVLDSSLHPLLDAGRRYWVGASSPTTTLAAWNDNSIGDVDTMAFLNAGITPLSVSTETRGALRVSGTLVPEPSSLITSGTAGILIGIFATYRRQAGAPRPKTPSR